MSGFWLFLLLLALVAFLVWVGYVLARERSRAEQEELTTQRQELDAAWTALEQARRVNEVFFHTRDAMRQAEAEAIDQERRFRA